MLAFFRFGNHVNKFFLQEENSLRFPFFGQILSLAVCYAFLQAMRRSKPLIAPENQSNESLLW